MKARDSSSVPTLSGLALLLILIIVAVGRFPVPDLPRGAEMPSIYLERHQEGYFFMQAETVAKQALANPAARWSHIGLDYISRCKLLNGQVWFATGTVDAPDKKGRMQQSRWEVCLAADTGTPLYTRVGNFEQGNLPEVWQAAGIFPINQIEKP